MGIIKNKIKQIHCVKTLLEEINYNKIIDYNSLPQEEKIKMLMDKYERLVGYRMDINNPKTFTEKLQWYKLFYEGDGNLIRVVDKFLFKDYIKEKLGEGYTIPLFGVYESFSQLRKDWDGLPEEFVLKSTLSSDGKMIKFVHKKSQINMKELKSEMEHWFKGKYLLSNGFCHAYNEGIPRVIAEQYLENVKDQLFDYKFFCFDGKPFCIYVAQDHFGKDGSHISFYDLDWNKLEVQYGNHIIGNADKPKHFEEMVRIAIMLSSDLPFVRVDFFDTEDHLYVAELTLYPGAGYTKYKPESFNVKMGDLFKLPIRRK